MARRLRYASKYITPGFFAQGLFVDRFLDNAHLAGGERGKSGRSDEYIHVETLIVVDGKSPLPGEGAFSLIELLVVITIVSMLLALMIPSLAKARNAARGVQCASNQRGIGIMVDSYTTEFGVYPAAYVFGCPFGTLSQGLQHWSDTLENRCSSPYISPVPAYGQRQPANKRFICPSFDQGGLPPANTANVGANQNTEGGQVIYGGEMDRQVRRLAYTVNEAIFPRPFMQGIVCDKWGGVPPIPVPETPQAYRYVQPEEIEGPSSTILLSEWNVDWRMLEGSGAATCMSFLPVHGFASQGSMSSVNRDVLGDVLAGSDAMDPYEVEYSNDPSAGGRLRRVGVEEVKAAASVPGGKLARVNLLGRNHNGKTHFAYVDGHVESKTIEQTVQDNEWGASFFSLRHGRELFTP